MKRNLMKLYLDEDLMKRIKLPKGERDKRVGG